MSFQPSRDGNRLGRSGVRVRFNGCLSLSEIVVDFSIFRACEQISKVVEGMAEVPAQR